MNNIFPCESVCTLSSPGPPAGPSANRGQAGPAGPSAAGRVYQYPGVIPRYNEMYISRKGKQRKGQMMHVAGRGTDSIAGRRRSEFCLPQPLRGAAAQYCARGAQRFFHYAIARSSLRRVLRRNPGLRQTTLNSISDQQHKC